MPFHRLFQFCLVCGVLNVGLIWAEDTPATIPADAQAIQQIRQLGGQVLELAQNDSRLDVAFHLSDRKLQDDQLAVIAPLSRLAILNLRGTEITDAGLVHLAGLKGLLRLHLEKTKITNAGLKHLAGLEQLEYLNLYGTAVTDDGLPALYSLKKLRRIYLWQTGVTDAGAAALKTALPELTIVRPLDPVPSAPPAEAPPAVPPQ